MKLKLITLMLSLFLLNAGCAMANKASDYKYYKASMNTVNYSDGISKEEAIIIARNSMIEDGDAKDFNLANPTVESGGLNDELWDVEFKARLWLEATRGIFFGTVYIDKKTGQVKGGGGSDL